MFPYLDVEKYNLWKDLTLLYYFVYQQQKLCICRTGVAGIALDRPTSSTAGSTPNVYYIAREGPACSSHM